LHFLVSRVEERGHGGIMYQISKIILLSFLVMFSMQGVSFAEEKVDVQELQELAEKGNAVAQSLLSGMYYHGSGGVVKSHTKLFIGEN